MVALIGVARILREGGGDKTQVCSFIKSKVLGFLKSLLISVIFRGAEHPRFCPYLAILSAFKYRYQLCLFDFETGTSIQTSIETLKLGIVWHTL